MSEIRPNQRKPIAKGTSDPSGRLIVACRFDERLYDEIYQLAAASNLSFAATVRALVSKGLRSPAVVERAA